MSADCETPPQGALRQADGSVLWRIWAPQQSAVSLVTFAGEHREETPMTPEGCGYFVHRRAAAQEGLRYAYKPADGRDYPDPASRWQPEGVHRPSALFLPDRYQWSDSGWRGISREELVIYELHVGTFTPEGTFAAIVPRLPELLELGVTAIELMPVAQFPGKRDWGYDAAYPFAVQHGYGGPRGLQQFIDAAHQSGMAVLLDVIYNHLGPEGSYAGTFGPYFTDRYHTPWGKAINYDGAYSDPVRQFVVDNARMWVRDFHADGLRLDAVQTIYDFSPRHILADIQAGVEPEAAAARRRVHVIAETDQNDVRLIRPRGRGGYQLDGVWSDDFHHIVHALLTGERDGYYEDFGRREQLAKAYNDVFVFDGCYSPFHHRRKGTRVGGFDRSHFVVCLQNHDQVGNRARGDRLVTLIPPPAQRLACGLLLLSPCLPLLFMGEEYGETNPFAFFSSFEDPQIVEGVRRGRREEFATLRFKWGIEIPDPQAAETFAAAKLSWSWPEGSPRAQLRQLYRDLLAARRQWPALRDRGQTFARLVGPDVAGEAPHRRPRVSGSSATADTGADGGTAESAPATGPAVLLLQRGGEAGIRAAANLTGEPASLAGLDLGGGELLLSTENERYGGARRSHHRREEVLPYEMLIFGSEGRP
jgi:maltooligosyltrehalose trehalohydrolase